MTLATSTARNDYTGTGALTDYDYTFKIFADSDLEVIKRDTSGVESTLALNTDYTVSGEGTTAGGTVSLDSVLESGYHLTIRRKKDLIQNTDLRNQGDYYPEDVEDEFDRGVMIAQQQQDEIDRAIKLPASIDPSNFNMELPSDIAANAGSVIMVNTAGDGLTLGVNNSGTDASKVSKTGDSMSGDLSMLNQKKVKFFDSGSAHSVDLLAKSTVTNHNIYLPPAATSSQLLNLASDGSMFSSVITALSTGYTITALDYTTYFTGNATGGSFTINLPAAASSTSRMITVTKIDSSANTVTIDGSGSETIQGQTTAVLRLQWDSITILCNGTSWDIVSRHYNPELQTFTPTGTWSSNCTYTGKWRRQGSFMEIYYHIALSGAPTAAPLRFNMPSGYTIDVTKMPNQAGKVGSFYCLDLGTALYTGEMRINNSSSMNAFIGQTAATYATITNVTELTPFTFGNTDTASANVIVPCAEFLL